MNNKRLASWLGILLVPLLLLSSCSTALPGQQPAPASATLTPSPGNSRDAIIAEGRLMPNLTATLAFQTAGRVKDLLVAEGSDVQSGQVIASLEGVEQAQAAVENAKFELLSAQQELDSLNDNYAGSLAAAQQQLAQAKIDLKKAQDDRTRMIYRRASDATLDGLRADVILAQKQLDNAQDFYDHHSGSDDLITAQALRDLASARLERDRAQYNLNYAADLPNQNEIDRADANVKIAQAKLDSARKSLDRLSSGPDSQALALALARHQKAEASLQVARVGLDNLNLKAPFAGRIVNLNMTQGEAVSPGQAIATLADFSRWIVETSDLTELDVIRLQVGQKAALVADALPGEKFAGTIERIGNAYVEKKGDITYTVRIALDQTDQRLRWGMTMAVTFDASAALSGGQFQPTAIQAAAPTAAPTALVAGAEDDQTGSAKALVEKYFTALQKQDPQSAAALLSNYSLVAEKTDRETAAGVLQNQMAQGTRWSDLAIQEARVQDDNTVLVHVVYQLTTRNAETGVDSQSQKDEWWPVRSENEQWLYNWNNVIDFRGLDLTPQTTAGLTVSPVQMTRYSDRLDLVLFVQNRTNDPIVLGQANEIMGLFTFGEKSIEAEKKQLVFDRLHSYPNVKIEVNGLFSSYPDKVEIRKWKNYQVAPWFTFILASGAQ